MNPYEPSFITHPDNSSYIWRTWFIEECDTNLLFGVNFANYLRLVEHGYSMGTELYLEDAPLFWKTKAIHRICGPYVIQGAALPHPECRAKYNDARLGKIIVYYDTKPELGPWLDDHRAQREIDGTSIRFQKKASEFNFFPYRFRIDKSPNHTIEIKAHSKQCGWCPFK